MPIKVLTIDDDPSMTNLLGVILSSQGMQVFSCNDGEAGIEVARKEKPDVIILDLMMPGTDGWEVCKVLRQSISTPILILSALDDPATISSGLDAGADDYMIKPVSTGVLIARIKMLTRRYEVEIQKSTMIRDSVVYKSASEKIKTVPIPLQALPPRVQ